MGRARGQPHGRAPQQSWGWAEFLAGPRLRDPRSQFKTWRTWLRWPVARSEELPGSEPRGLPGALGPGRGELSVPRGKEQASRGRFVVVKRVGVRGWARPEEPHF